MKYKRILLKLSGESLQGRKTSGIDHEILSYFGLEINEIIDLGVEAGIVFGGGNIFRGLSGVESGLDRYKGDQMGMLATVINSLALEGELKTMGINAKVFTSIRMEPVGELYHRDKVLDAMKNNTVCILAGGTGNPFFTTDTAAALRAVEIGADVLLKGTRVDGVYSSDPEKNIAATRFTSISYDDVIQKQLKVMDLTAFTMCRENKIPIVVFDMNKKGNLKKIIAGQPVGTIIS
ncbi:MAG TPA: UMP kinase [Bacteroidales bacterium]|nr:UMP kinase [Bacteroidales bacterium]